MSGKSTVAVCLVSAAMLVGVTAATASAKQPDTPFVNISPFSNQCAKAAGTYQSAFDSAGMPTHLSCSPTTQFSQKEVSQLANACVQVGVNFGAQETFLIAFPTGVSCDFTY